MSHPLFLFIAIKLDPIYQEIFSRYPSTAFAERSTLLLLIRNYLLPVHQFYFVSMGENEYYEF